MRSPAFRYYMHEGPAAFSIVAAAPRASECPETGCDNARNFFLDREDIVQFPLPRARPEVIPVFRVV